MDLGIMIDQLTLHEGRRRFPYTDSVRKVPPYTDSVGKLTIGVGRNLTDRGLSEEEINFLLANDIRDHWDGLVVALPWIYRLDPVRQRVLMDMAFNLGVAGLLTFKQTLASVEHGKYAVAAAGMLRSKWARQVGRRAERLSEMMETGIDSADFSRG